MAEDAFVDNSAALGHTGAQPASDVPFLSETPPCKYLRKRQIGKGAYGEAWMVQRMSDKATYVAKVVNLKDTPERRRRYTFTEIRCLANCDHPNVIRYVEDSGGEGDQLVIIMELADAGDLGTQLKNHKVRFTEREAGILFAQLVLALHHIHSRRMIHRDIKSGNILLSSCGLIKVGDFGFSQLHDSTVAESQTFLGTPYYLAPEMWRGNRYGKKADVWAAGIVLYEILAHRRPFHGQSIQELKEAVLSRSVEPISGVTRDMEQLVNATLSLDPEQRPSSTQLLGMHVMQHYLALFLNIVMRDSKIPQEMKESIMRAIQQAEDDVKAGNSFDSDRTDPRYEGPVQKETDGTWKERFLILQPPDLIMTLAHGKEAAPGTDRSKRIPLSHVSSVVSLPQQDSDGRFLFAVQLVNGSAIVLAVTDSTLRGLWVGKLQTALGMG